MREVFRLQRATVVVDDYAQTVHTVFDDAYVTPGIPQYNAESKQRACELGYGDRLDPVWEMTRTHDLFHTLVAEAEGRDYSAALRPVATGEPFDKQAVHREECLVFLLQRMHAQGEAFLLEKRVPDGEVCSAGQVEADRAGRGVGEARGSRASAGHGGGGPGARAGVQPRAGEVAPGEIGQATRRVDATTYRKGSRQ